MELIKRQRRWDTDMICFTRVGMRGHSKKNNEFFEVVLQSVKLKRCKKNIKILLGSDNLWWIQKEAD